MPRAMLCLAAKGVIRDAETNNISIFSLLETMTPQGFPAFMQELSVFVLWQRQPEDPPGIDVQFRTLNNAHLLHELVVHVAFGEGQMHRSIITLVGLVLTEPGHLTFTFAVNGAEIARYDIAISPPQAQVVAHAG
jgi:hypothetical protein